MKNRSAFLLLFFLCCLPAFTQVYLDPSQPLEARVKDLVSRMTVNEKITQMGNRAPAIPRLKVGAYDYWSEALHGVARQGLATVFPQAVALGSTWNPELLERITNVISTEARAKANQGSRNYLTFWSPTINLLRDPRWGREEEGYSEDPFLTGRMGTAFVRGMQGYDPKYLKTVSTVKHFAANNSEFNRHRGSSDMDERDLREYYLAAFKTCVTEGKVQSLMGAYNSLNGVPCCANKTLITDILRGEWGFDGFTVSDCGAIQNIFADHRYVKTPQEAAALGVKAGIDINCGRTYQLALEQALRKNLLTEADIDQALFRAFRARFRLGEFDPADKVPYRSIPYEKLDAPEHRVLALEAARQAIVLLKNEKNILPLDPAVLKSIAVIGPNADRAIFGGYSGTPSFHVTPLDGIRERLKATGVNVSYAQGCSVKSTDEGGIPEAADLARRSDAAVVVIGTDLTTSDEGRDRRDIILTGAQENLVKAVLAANKKTVVVLVNGQRLAINWIQDNVPGIICAWYDGQSQGTAIAEVLFGDYNPGGRLTTTWYKSLDGIPPIDQYSLRDGKRTYWYYEGPVLYPFGHGLSYSTFGYRGLKLSRAASAVGGRLDVSLTVTNTGKRAGDEVIQMYVHNNDVKEKLPIKKLVGFQRVTLKPGAKTTVTLPLAVTGEMLGYWDAAKHDFILKPGVIDIMVGSSSGEIRLKGKLRVTGGR